MDNLQVARQIFSVASLLESQGANPFRVRAYRRAAISLLSLPVEATRFTNEAGELALPWLGERLRRKLGELVTRGQMQFYQELLAELPQSLRELLEVPGVGLKTAPRLIGELGIGSVAELAAAAQEGRLRRLRGIGAVREAQLGAAARTLLARAA